MKKKIRIVWWITIASACLVIGMQSYWLYSQYLFVTDQYIHEVMDKIVAVMDSDYQNRSKNTKKSFTYNYNISRDYTSKEKAVQNMIIISTGVTPDSINEPVNLTTKSMLLSDSLIQESNMNLSWMKRDTFKAEVPEAIFYDALHHYIAEVKNKLVKERIDSLILDTIPEISFTTDYYVSDSTLWDTHWEKTSSLFSPAMELIYPYSPLEKKSLLFTIQIPVNPLLKGMLFQLLLGLVFILLLVGCLIYQLRIIFKQRELSTLQYSFVNTMIHELKRPVQTLKMLISFLNNKQMRQDETVSEQVVQDSFSELDRLSAYLTKLKDMVRADGAETLLHYEQLSVKEVIEKALRITPVPTGKQVSFTTNYSPEKLEIEADPVHFNNLINNLIENAIKYSGEAVDIRIDAQLQNKVFELSVSDNGFGINKMDQEHVFEKFYRGSNLPDNPIPGIGLGLSYVKLIAEAHHGTVTLRSRIGEGTTVIIRLPQ